MNRTAADFRSLIERHFAEVAKKQDPTYGANVVPLVRLYQRLSLFEERDAFLSALENLVASDDPAVRRDAITLCLGFVVFRDVV